MVRLCQSGMVGRSPRKPCSVRAPLTRPCCAGGAAPGCASHACMRRCTWPSAHSRALLGRFSARTAAVALRRCPRSQAGMQTARAAPDGACGCVIPCSSRLIPLNPPAGSHLPAWWHGVYARRHRAGTGPALGGRWARFGGSDRLTGMNVLQQRAARPEAGLRRSPGPRPAVSQSRRPCAPPAAGVACKAPPQPPQPRLTFVGVAAAGEFPRSASHALRGVALRGRQSAPQRPPIPGPRSRPDPRRALTPPYHS